MLAQSVETTYSALWIAAGLSLLALILGAATGYFLGRGKRKQAARKDGVDRRRLVQMLRDLTTWTHEYRGGVAAYQDELTEISHRAEHSQNASADDDVLPLVHQIMQTNQQLQFRLDAAERQLADQTARIESYLTEARTDGLTGLANRRAFDQKLDEIFARSQQSGTPFVLGMIDIDHFKQFNDTHGHQVGDAVLTHVATLMRHAFSDAHIVARFGGEEFAMLLDSPLQTATGKLDAFRKQCARESLHVEDQELTITLSVGASELRSDQVIGPLVRRADEALYAAKGTGRNRTYYHDGSEPSLFGAPEPRSNQ